MMNRNRVALLLVAVILGSVRRGWGLTYPWSRLVRGTLATLAAESNYGRAGLTQDDVSVGDSGNSLGPLQYNKVRCDLLSNRPCKGSDDWQAISRDWRASWWWSGWAVGPYLEATDGRLPSLRAGEDGLAAWRSLWIRGAAGEPGDLMDVGPIALGAWEEAGAWTWIATVLQVVILAVLLAVAPILLPVLAIVAVLGWVAR